MLPLAEETIVGLFLAAVAVLAALLAARRGRPRFVVLALLFLLALLWPWALALRLGLDGYTIRMAVIYGAVTALAFAAGTLWGLAARLIPAATLVLAIAPSLAASAWLLERQRVPDAPCAQRALLDIGDLAFAIPRTLTVRGQGDAWTGTYGDDPRVKPAVRALCRASDGGTRPLDLSHLWITSYWIRPHRLACEAGTAPPEHAAFCAALPRTRPTVVQLYAKPFDRPLPSAGLFDAKALADALAEGRTRGVRCNQGTPSPGQVHCTIWQPLGPEVLAVTSAYAAESAAEDELHADLTRALGILRDDLARR